MNVCFIHSTNTSLWKDDILNRLLAEIISSELIEKLDFVFVNNIGNPIHGSIHPKIIIENYSQDLSRFETCTIRSMHSFARIHPDAKILYMHTKGVSYDPDHPFMDAILKWNSFMTYCLVTHGKECLAMLDVYEAVGCNYRPQSNHQENPAHFSGNFWWATAKYIGTLPVDYLHDKYHPEFWLLQNKAKIYNVYTLEHMYQVAYPRENYQEIVDRRFRENILFCQFGSSGIGLCNQLYSLVNTLVMGETHHGHTLVVVNDFLTDIESNVYCDAGEILDMPRMNEFLADYGITLVSKRVKMEIKKVTFGRYPLTIDITDQCNFFEDNCFRVPRGFDLNTLCGDPMGGQRKHVYVEYTVNGFPFHKTFDELDLVQNEDLLIDFRDYQNVSWMSYTFISDFQRKKSFDLFLKQISFQSKFKLLADRFVSEIRMFRKINILHLRNEPDAIDFWSYVNHIDKHVYREKLESKYIQMIKKYIDKDSMTIVLSMNTDNAVLTFMKDNRYPFCFTNKSILVGRDVNAIVDFLISKYCTHVFIGNINPHTFCGSTFSYAILNQLSNRPVKKICIDTDHIDASEYVL